MTFNHFNLTIWAHGMAHSNLITNPLFTVNNLQIHLALFRKISSAYFMDAMQEYNN